MKLREPQMIYIGHKLHGKVYFPATDVARKLGYSNPHKATTDHCRYLTKRKVPHPQSSYKTIGKILFLKTTYID